MRYTPTEDEVQALRDYLINNKVSTRQQIANGLRWSLYRVAETLQYIRHANLGWTVPYTTSGSPSYGTQRRFVVEPVGSTAGKTTCLLNVYQRVGGLSAQLQYEIEHIVEADIAKHKQVIKTLLRCEEDLWEIIQGNEAA